MSTSVVLIESTMPEPVTVNHDTGRPRLQPESPHHVSSALWARLGDVAVQWIVSPL